MNDVDELLRSALRARADEVQDRDLRPLVLRRHRPAWRWAGPALAAAAVLIVVVTVALVRSPATHRSVTPAGPQPTATDSRTVPGQEVYCVFDDEGCPGSNTPQFIQLWPFASYTEAHRWETVDGPAGHSPWHSDAAATALFFVQNYLGFHDITKVTNISIDDWPYARVAVGYGTHTAATIELVRYSPERGNVQAGWEVVGATSTDFWLDTPKTGNLVSSPMMVLGRITGVDESVSVAVRGPTGGEQHAAPVPAGGNHAPWSATVRFTVKGPLMVVASTGGHVTTHERFCVVGVVSAGG